MGTNISDCRSAARRIRAYWSTSDSNRQVAVSAFQGSRHIATGGSVPLSQGRGEVGGLQPNGRCYGIQVTISDTNTSHAKTQASWDSSIFYEATVSSCATNAVLDLASPSPVDQRLFHLLVPEGKFVGHYVRQGTSGGWERVDKLDLPAGEQVPDTGVAHIQSFFEPDHLNALAWLQPGGDLVTFEYNSDTGEQQPIPVSTEYGPVTNVNGTPALVQTDQELFHLLVPVANPTQQIIHLIHSSDTIQGPWQQVATLPWFELITIVASVVSIALTQADGDGSLKAIVRLRLIDGSDVLVSYQSDPQFQWQGPFPVFVGNLPTSSVVSLTNPGGSFASPQGITITNVAGSPGLDQSIFGDQEQLNLLVPLVDTQAGDITLTQFTQPAGPGTSINQPWTFARTLQPLNGDPKIQVVSVSIIQDSNGDLESMAHVITPDGEPLLAFYLFNPQTGVWSPPSVVTNQDGQPIVVGQPNGLITIDNCEPTPNSSMESITATWHGVPSNAGQGLLHAFGGPRDDHSAVVSLNSGKGQVNGLLGGAPYEVYLTDTNGNKISTTCQTTTTIPLITINNCEPTPNSTTDSITANWQVVLVKAQEAFLHASSGPRDDHSAVVSLNGGTGQVNGLSPNTTYQVYLADGNKNKISTICQTTTGVALITIDTCEPTPNSPIDSITATWTWFGAADFQVQLHAKSSPSDDQSVAVSVGANKGSVSGLQPSTLYQIYLTDTNGNKISTTCQATTQNRIP